MTTLLDQPLVLSMVLFLFLSLAVDFGFRLAVMTGVVTDDHRREQIAASRDALDILLSLLLGFTLAMALPRYDLRNQLVMDEANAIATTGLRAAMLPEAQRIEVHSLLVQYVDARIQYSRATVATGDFSAAIERSRSLQSALWQSAVEASRQSPTPVTTLFVASLNDTIDLSEKRLIALENRIPPSIWLMLLLIALLTCFTFGYGQRRRFWLVTVVSPLMIAIVMGLIADLDSPRSGFLRPDPRSLERVAHDLKAAPNSTPPTSPH